VEAIDLSRESCKTENEIEEDTCRFCLYEEMDEINDPLINACDCDGSMKFIHVKCLQKWNMDKVQIKQTVNSKSYLWKVLECEICKYVYHGNYSIISTRYHLS
jgi:E3 ubiquitin-protein ligase DOA10